MDKFKDKYRITSARAPWHEYDGGCYFVTICTADKTHYFGEIRNGVMELSEIGHIACKSMKDITSFYPYARIPQYTVMPNHIHAIITIDGSAASGNKVPNHTTADRNPMKNKCLGTVIRGIKARITHFAHKHDTPFAWQSRFYDRIIRNKDEMNRIALYMEHNVAQWDLDELNTNTCRDTIHRV